MESGGGEKPLRRIAAAFEALEASSKTAPMEVDAFSRACSQVSFLFGCLGIAFKFAEMDYVAKDCVKQGGSHSRNLLRVKRGLDMVKVLFEQILEKDDNSLRDPATVAYAKVFAPHHGWAIRKAVAAGMYALPSKAQLVKKLNEDEASARTYMQTYIRSSGPVIAYVEELYNSRQMGIDW
ncbi:accelerated cell death 11-like isoform X2 [Curcuma longa]|uniref:accelerated cell death 11-like isoform X2 n=1 Tax=Curcuma longa TaxID=136217 RepID=UPI003D9F3C71